ncbi:hypothetical protein GCM10011491_09060 [Brucella endophytica]|uniref:Uncharacterized protein n=1 Tax=Brucella endophytica TaxID=1963359 RepID=A0A916S4Y8_9HYPH|nr:hypothetical protein [Brucella endophytica]GGA83776.1 hypothetical protein GCM10011491_09060 [Brucella endophytica]
MANSNTENSSEENRPPLAPQDGTRATNLPRVSILYQTGGIIDTNSLKSGEGLAVSLPYLVNYRGQPVTFLFYMNGYVRGTSERRADGPPNPDYIINTTLASSIVKTEARLPREYAEGFAAIATKVPPYLHSYVDYFIGSIPGAYIYGPYPTASVLTNT